MTPARKKAFEILRLVEGGGYAADLLYARTKTMSSRDAALTEELVLGVLRRKRQLDHLIEYFSGEPAERLDREVRIALELGIYQLRFLDRIPPHAAVSESVDLVKHAHKRSAAGFVNAVLRKVNRDPIPWPNRAVELSVPDWLFERWSKFYGPEGAERIARVFLEPPKTYIRVPPGRESELAGKKVEPTEIPGCYLLLEGDARPFRRQDISSQWVVTLLDLQPGTTLLDLCAAPGNKTAQALEITPSVIACDRNFRKLVQMEGIPATRIALDALKPLPFRTNFPRILLDAPCSGTGTLARNPEIKWRLVPEQLEQHHKRQVQLLRTALEVLAPGGVLVYSTCSLEYEEGEQVVSEALEEADARFRIEYLARRIPGVDAGDGFFAAVISSE